MQDMVKGENFDELPSVMAEIKVLMSARGTALTLHPDEPERPQVIYSDESFGPSGDLVESLLVRHIDWSDADRPDVHRWVACDPAEPCRDVMLIPVQTIPGHSRLMISVFFDNLTDALRNEAERIYLERAPLAVGYFRLWQLNRARERQSRALQAALNLTETGIILLDRSAKLTFANRVAKEMLTAGAGLLVRKGTVRAAQLRDSVRLHVAIEHVISANGTGSVDKNGERHAPLLSLERADAPPLIISVLPTEDRASEPDDVAAIIYVLDPSRNLQSAIEPICKIYRLSPVETRLACQLVGGSALIDAAKSMRIKPMTARSYLKQIFIKTNTHRQTELMQLMLSSVIHTGPGIVTEPVETV